MIQPHSIPPAVSALVGRFAALLRAELGDSVRDVILFGSHARGQGHEESDVDVAVIVADPAFALRVRVLNVAADLSLESGLDLSPTVIDLATWDKWRAQERPLARDIERDGVRA